MRKGPGRPDAPRARTANPRGAVGLRELRDRLAEAEETLRAIRGGEVDAVIVDGPQGEQVYTLRTADYTYRVLLETLNEGALTMTKDGDILYCNRRFAEMAGRPLEKIITLPFRELVPAADHPALDTLFRRAAAGGASGECRLATAGEPLPVQLSVKPVELDGVPAVCLVATDLSGQKQNEQLIRRMQKMEALGTLAGGIAHDINNILAPILVNAELALQADLGAEPRRGLEIVLEAAQRGRRLVKQILTFAATSDSEKGPRDLAPIVEESLRLVRSMLPTTIDIRSDIAGAPGLVLANATQIEQVILNLCSNAAHAMREKGGVLGIDLAGVRLTGSSPDRPPELPPGAYLRLTVSDTGCGMPPEVMDRIFDPFFTTKSVAEGSGMGLPVVYGIVKAHGGAISVSSTPGKGSAFSVFLLRIESEAVRPAAPAEPLTRGRERILLVDDEEIQLRSLKPALERLGYSVATESDSEQALLAFQARPEHFDLVIVDQTMPRLTGAQLAAAMIGLRPGLPTILCTGFSEEIDPERAAGLGIREFLLKPFGLAELAAAIRRALGSVPGAAA